MLSNTGESYKQFKRKTNEQLIYDNPQMYVGGIILSEQKQLIFNYDEGNIIHQPVMYIQAIINIFMEVLLNASDKTVESVAAGIDTPGVEVDFDNQSVSVTNYGISIPINQHLDVEGQPWVPEMILGMTNTSGNYDKTEKNAGRFGQGAKITNIFSNVFEVYIVNQGLRYTQRWENNMKAKSKPVVEETDENNMVRITYVLDFQRFGLEEYSPEMLYLMANRVLLLSIATKLPVSINRVTYNFSSLVDYYQSIRGEHEFLYHREDQETGYFEFLMACTVNEPLVVAMCNSIFTLRGAHIEKPYHFVFDKILAEFNKKFEDGENKRKKVYSIEGDVKPHITLLVNYRNTSASLTGGQYKEELEDKTIPKLNIPKAKLAKVKEWQVVKAMDDDINNRLTERLKKLEKVNFKKLRLDPEKYRVCSWSKLCFAKKANSNGQFDQQEYDKWYRTNYAKWSQTIFLIMEGDSAAQYGETLASLLGVEFVSYCPIKGKFINSINHEMRLEFNEEFKVIKQILNLREGVDYTDPINRATLTHANIYILPDEDNDGKHIKGLLALLFLTRYPSLFEVGAIHFKMTALLRVKHKNTVYTFYSEESYQEWRQQTGINAKPRYYKGLGANTKDDIRQDIELNKQMQVLLESYEDKEAMVLAFDKRNRDDRKRIILAADPIDITSYDQITLKEFVHNDLIHYWYESITRAIPRLDLMKEGQRKVLWGALKKWNYSDKKDEHKLVDFASFVSEQTSYRHGPVSLYETIIKMTNNSPGSNNCSFFTPMGQYGNRRSSKKSADRYLYIVSEHWLQYNYRKEDEPFLEIVKEEGKAIEPKILLPVIPPVFNGCRGVASGWSTKLEKYHPADIVDWFIAMNRGEKPQDLVPWYNGFKGNVKVEDNKVIVEGCYEVIGETTTLVKLRITEIPIIGKNNKVGKYIKNVLHKLEDGDPENNIPSVLQSFEDRSVENYVEFELKLNKAKLPENVDYVDLLQLRVSETMSNIVLLDENDTPIKYSTIKAYLQTYYKFRLPYYAKRKDHILQCLKDERTKNQNIIDFINLIKIKKLSLIDYDDVKMKALLQEHNLPEDMLKLSFAQVGRSNIGKLTKKIENLTLKIDDLDARTPQSLWIADLEELRPHLLSAIVDHEL